MQLPAYRQHTLVLTGPPARLATSLPQKNQVDWFAPRPLWEFFTKFNVPKNQTKWTSRLKCNLYYYRTNYLGLLLLALAGAFLRAPLGMAASALLLTALLCFNDPFAATLK